LIINTPQTGTKKRYPAKARKRLVEMFHQPFRIAFDPLKSLSAHQGRNDHEDRRTQSLGSISLNLRSYSKRNFYFKAYSRILNLGAQTIYRPIRLMLNHVSKQHL